MNAQPFPSSLTPHLQQILLTQGKSLFRQGSKPKYVFYVMTGEIQLVRHSRHGQAVVLHRSTGGFIAEASVDSSAYHCDAICSRSGQIIAAPLPLFRKELGGNRAFADNWRQLLASELRRSRAQSERLTLRSARERILHLIETEGTGGKFRLPGSIKALAHELGISHEVLYRTLSDLVSQGAIIRTPALLALTGSWPDSDQRNI